MLKVLIIDNYDSFVYNLVQCIGELGVDVVVCRNDKVSLEEIVQFEPDRIVFSSGFEMFVDGKSFGVCESVLQTLSPKVPTLGVCLGHQSMIRVYGGRVVSVEKVLHGKPCLVKHDGQGLFVGVRNPFSTIRYHSFVGDRCSLPSCLQITAEAVVGGEIMGVRHVKFPVFGVQFHPGSILCQDGKLVLRNFIEGAYL